MKQTVLHDTHVRLGARMAPFGGFNMPIQYEGIVREHQACRCAAALFDTCHMGEFGVSGPHALEDLERLISSDVGALEPGRCRNGFFCNPDGGVIDDLIVYRLGDAEFLVVVNASTREEDAAWIGRHLSADTRLEDLSDSTGKLDLQGPFAPQILQKLTDTALASLRYYDHRMVRIGRTPARVSRTGYTGEIGFELYCATEHTVDLWDLLVEAGAQPAGLGARDTLRLEMGLPLYGHELAADRNAGESGFDRLLATSKDFVGAAAVRDPARRRQRLTSLLLEGRGTAHTGDAVRTADGGHTAGVITSGSFSPCLARAIALAYVDSACAAPGMRLAIAGERQTLLAEVVERPFYRHATARRPIAEFL